MNRRKFIASSTMGAGALSMFPMSAFANSSEKIFKSKFEDSFNSFNVAIESLSNDAAKTFEDMKGFLKESNYSYNTSKLMKFNDVCYAIPLEKKSLLGFNSNELGLIVNQNGTSKFYILNEKITEEFQNLNEGFSLGIEESGGSIDVAKFIFPQEVIEEKKGRESVFAYKNALNDTITFKSSRKGTRAIIS
ncbi:hypothetical protein [Tenacibaculum xiamenense]|uniref:hypothetical protein n=1 Tax=Tenacibaculum xiamenense TaxID=1261553 RepID=UPI003896588B